MSKHSALRDKASEPEKRTEDFLRDLFEALGWRWLSNEVIPQRRVKSAAHTRRVDFAFKKSGELRPSFYLEAKAFSDPLENEDHVRQALDYGKNGGIRGGALTNFTKWSVFNSDFFGEPEHAEVFEFTLADCLKDDEKLGWLMLFSREKGGGALDEHAKLHKQWKESADIEDLLTRQLDNARAVLSKAIWEQNTPKFDTGQVADNAVDESVQHILNRLIFCRLLEDNGGDPEHRMRNEFDAWQEGDKRAQFYKERLCKFFLSMEETYDSTIFEPHRIDRLSIKNEDFVPVFESFYTDTQTGLRYRFDAINLDVLGHAYENYLSSKFSLKRRSGSGEEKKFTRKQSGIYYTPEFLVDYLVRSTLGEKLAACKTPEQALKIRVIDPACGSGTFLVKAFDVFKEWFIEFERRKPGRESLHQTRLDAESDSGTSNFLDEVLENCLYGMDLDPRAVRLARLNLFLRAVKTPKKLPQLKGILERNSLVWDAELEKFGNGTMGMPFIFERDFPLIAEEGGFDVAIGNPPWEKWKPDSQEFFEVIEPGFKSLPAQEAKRRMAEILKTRKMIRAGWENRQRQFEIIGEFFHENYSWQSADAGGRKSGGDLDLYKLFTERFHALLKPGGVAGIVVPSGIYTDLGAKGLRTLLFDHSKIKGLYSFENRGHAIFPDVHASFKPTLLTFEKGGKTKEFHCAFYLHSPEDLRKALERPTVMGVDFVKKASPVSWGVLEIKSRRDYEIVQKMLKFPVLGEDIEGAWNIRHGRGFDMNLDSGLFQNKLGVPMLEGKNIQQFTHQWKEAPTPRYTISERDIQKELPGERDYHNEYYLGFRRIARSTDSRTLMTTVIPPNYVVSESISFARLPEVKQLCFLCGVLNSFVVDYFIRQKVSANINMFYFLEIPVPRLDSGKEFDAIVRKVAQLVCVTGEFEELKKATGVSHGLDNESDRALARAQLDAMVAKLYGITKEELAFILEKFPIVDEKQKEAVLRAY